MKRTMVLLWGFLAIALVINVATAQKKATVWPAENIKWIEMKGGPPGVSYANLWGDMTKTGYGALVQLPKGMTDDLHTHTATLKMVIISGTFLYTPEGGTEQRLGPGSYLVVPGGVRHTSGVGSDGPCEVFQESQGKFDFVPAASMKK